MFFFFQAEDGIRGLYVTGVQTCALPIFGAVLGNDGLGPRIARSCKAFWVEPSLVTDLFSRDERVRDRIIDAERRFPGRSEEPSCRERVEISVVAGSVIKERGQE